MIDIHSHILPNIDDGAQSEKESQLMLKNAIADGIQTIVATPHYHPRYRNEKEDILTSTRRLQQIAKKKKLKIDILPGQEIRVYGDLIEDYEAGKLLSLTDHSRYLLIEFPARQVPNYVERLFYEIEQQGLTPIIAHPERNLEFLEKPDKLYNLVAHGAFAQLTTASLLGDFGGKVQKFSYRLIESNLVHFLATDAHNTTNRSFNMSQAYEKIESKYGLNYATYLMENAKLLIEDKPIYAEQPQRIEKKKFLGIF